MDEFLTWDLTCELLQEFDSLTTIYIYLKYNLESSGASVLREATGVLPLRYRTLSTPYKPQYIYMYIYIHIYKHIYNFYMYLYIYMHIYIHTYTYTHVYLHNQYLRESEREEAGKAVLRV